MDVVAEVASWQGVSRRPGPNGGAELRYGERLLGTVHDDGGVELAFHRRVREMLVETGRAEPHARAGLVAFRGSAEEAVELFRLAWERARVTAAVRAARR